MTDEKKENEGKDNENDNKKSPLSGITNDDKGSPMRQSVSREVAKKILEDEARGKDSGRGR